MVKAMFCKHCNRNITPTKKFNWLAFLFLPVLGGPVYLFIYLFKKKRCPICGNQELEPEKEGI